MKTQLTPNILNFLTELKENNHKDWMTTHKKRYLTNEKILKSFYAEVHQKLDTFDKIERLKVFRINRDIRFSNDKTPYNVHRSASYHREGTHRRGGYYLRIEPNGKSLVGGGFYAPEPVDLLRIRKEFEMDAKPIRDILAQAKFKKAYGNLNQNDRVKTAPKGFDKEDPNIDLIRLKNFYVGHNFSDREVLAPDFADQVAKHYRLLLPFFDHMSDVLTTDLNGESLI